MKICRRKPNEVALRNTFYWDFSHIIHFTHLKVYHIMGCCVTDPIHPRSFFTIKVSPRGAWALIQMILPCPKRVWTFLRTRLELLAGASESSYGANLYLWGWGQCLGKDKCMQNQFCWIKAMIKVCNYVCGKNLEGRLNIFLSLLVWFGNRSKSFLLALLD